MTDVRFTDFHLFCGAGGGALGFSWATRTYGALRGSFRSLGGVDSHPRRCADFGLLLGKPATCMDLFSAEDYADFHGKAPPDGWREATPADIRAAAGGERPDVVFTSAPCLPGDGLVVTSEGPREIQSIRAGDLVLTHLGRYRNVTHVGTHIHEGALLGVRTNGSVDRQWFTPNHPIWVRRPARKSGAGPRPTVLSAPQFIDAGRVRVGDRVGFPVGGEALGTALRLMGRCIGAPRAYVYWPVAGDLWFVLGMYVGDGYRNVSRGETIFCVGSMTGRKFAPLLEALGVLGYHARVDASAGDGNVKVVVRSDELMALCGIFGDGAPNKSMPAEMFLLEQWLVERFIAGYRITDGSVQGRRKARNVLQARWRIASTSLQLLRDLQRLLLRTRTFGFINKTWDGGEQVIEGRTVQTLPRWELNVRLDPKKRTTAEFIDDHVWVRVRDIERREGAERVWNLSVDEDDTFCAPLMVTHNCKGFSGLLSGDKAASPKYQALNRLTLRGIWLALEAWADDPPGFVVFENVPRIVQRGAHLLEQIVGLLGAYGYAVHKDAHDCGELGGLAQHRQRFLLLARHVKRVRPFLYKPELQRVRAIGDVVGPMAMPEDAAGGPMHRLPRLKMDTLVRLALIPAGKDWRALKSVDHTQLRMVPVDAAGPKFNNCFRIVSWGEASPAVTGGAGPSSGGLAVADPRPSGWNGGKYRVTGMDEAAGAVIAESGTGNGAFSVADPRVSGADWHHGVLGVRPFDTPAATVTGASAPQNGAHSIADPRFPDGTAWRQGVMGVQSFDEPSIPLTGRTSATNGAFSVADPRLGSGMGEKSVTLRVKPWNEPAPTVTGNSSVWDSGGFAVGDPRLNIEPRNGTLGVQAWDRPGATVTASLDVQAGPAAVQDPRKPGDAPVVIIAQDGTWHRPLTAWELAALQSLPLTVNGAPLVFHGSPTEWREAIGNMVPPRSAQAIAEVLLDTLLQELAGVTFSLGGGSGIWVNPDDRIGRALGWQA